MVPLSAWKKAVLALRSSRLLQARDIAHQFAGKEIALVGNACSLASKQLGEQIDACDLVIRFNHCPCVGTVSHGRRTDWIALSTRISKRLYHDLGASGILWFTTRRMRMPYWLPFEKQLFVYPAQQVRELMSKTADRPTTGLMMIQLLSTFETGRIKLFGFDFFKSLSLCDPTRVSTPHDFSAEEAYVRQLIQRDERFLLCDGQ